jgi:hypothetical protein
MTNDERIRDKACTCLTISRDPLCVFHGDVDKVQSVYPTAIHYDAQPTSEEDAWIRIAAEDARDANARYEALKQDIKAQLRTAWEAGFRLCRTYGDNHAHFDGAQKEAQWKKFLSERHCSGCGFSKSWCDTWKQEGRVACCPDCKHPEIA